MEMMMMMMMEMMEMIEMMAMMMTTTTTMIEMKKKMMMMEMMEINGDNDFFPSDQTKFGWSSPCRRAACQASRIEATHVFKVNTSKTQVTCEMLMEGREVRN
eukprot:463852-Hanusia_phi.AAC.1